MNSAAIAYIGMIASDRVFTHKWFACPHRFIESLAMDNAPVPSALREPVRFFNMELFGVYVVHVVSVDTVV